MFITLTILLSSLLGFIIPYLSRRFAKFMPADAATAFVFMWHLPHFPKPISKKHQTRFKSLWQKLLISSVFCAALSGLLAVFLLLTQPLPIALSFLLLSLAMIFMAFIDARFQILPDILTVPLLLLGIASAYFYEHITIEESILGSLFGYFVPTIAGVLMCFRCHRAIGGGDIKLLSALGAWFGIIGLNFIIIFSAIFFGLYTLITKRRIAPYGPFMAMAAILMLLLSGI